MDSSTRACWAWSALQHLVLWSICLFWQYCILVLLCGLKPDDRDSSDSSSNDSSGDFHNSDRARQFDNQGYDECAAGYPDALLSIPPPTPPLVAPFTPSWSWMNITMPLSNTTLDLNITKVFERAPGLRPRFKRLHPQFLRVENIVLSTFHRCC